jgi:hypothetical protein
LTTESVSCKVDGRCVSKGVAPRLHPRQT